MDKWGLYELLKGKRALDDESIKEVEKMSREELREGLLNYLGLLVQQQTRPP